MRYTLSQWSGVCVRKSMIKQVNIHVLQKVQCAFVNMATLVVVNVVRGRKASKEWRRSLQQQQQPELVGSGDLQSNGLFLPSLLLLFSPFSWDDEDGDDHLVVAAAAAVAKGTDNDKCSVFGDARSCVNMQLATARKLYINEQMSSIQQMHW